MQLCLGGRLLLVCADPFLPVLGLSEGFAFGSNVFGLNWVFHGGVATGMGIVPSAILVGHRFPFYRDDPHRAAVGFGVLVSPQLQWASHASVLSARDHAPLSPAFSAPLLSPAISAPMSPLSTYRRFMFCLTYFIHSMFCGSRVLVASAFVSLMRICL